MGREIIHTLPILELGPEFYDPVKPARFAKALLRFRHQELAQRLHLDSLTDAQWQDHFWAFQALPGNLKEPLALRYHGHQFTHYNPDLGDGRGFLFAQFPLDNTWYDLGTKGSGQTPYSRDGDGRLTLKGAFREALATELLESLGVNTSKTLSIFETGENLVRYDEPSPTRAAVLVRFNHGHIRIGTFERLAFLKQSENIQKLVDVCLKTYYPEIHSEDADERASLFFQAVVQKCALLTSQWMMAGFVHGVLNTDNINITGESFDYGPYRFLPKYDLRFTAAYFDQQGLYSFGRQPVTMLWNLERLAEALMLRYKTLPAEETLGTFSDEFNTQTRRIFFKRLNLQPQNSVADTNLLTTYFHFLESSQAGFEQSFFDFFGGSDLSRIENSPQKNKYSGAEFEALLEALKQFETADPTKLSHPYFKNSEPCTLLIEEIESIWKSIAEADAWDLFEQKIKQIRSFRGLY